MRKFLAGFTVLFFCVGAVRADEAAVVANTGDEINPEQVAEQSQNSNEFQSTDGQAENNFIIPSAFPTENQTPVPAVTDTTGISGIATNPAETTPAADGANTDCATRFFANALAATVGEVNQSDPEYIIQGWIYKNFQSPDVIKQVLTCPELINTSDEETIKFGTVITNLPGSGRKIVVNYETQPKILKQRLMIANKRALPETNPNPRIGAADDPAVWTNTDPAWYGILVVESGSLDAFVGADKNNTLSLKYLEQNIDKFYPQDGRCTSKSAMANNKDIINITMHNTVNLKDDTNDYYVAGDVNLQWITWAEVGLDVAITVLTVGGGTVIMGMTKGVRAAKAAKGLVNTIKALEKSDKVKDYIRLSQQSARAAEELKAIDRTTDAARYAAKSDEIKRLGDGIRDLEKIEDVSKYKNATTAFEGVMKYRQALKAWKIPQRGNVIARVARSTRAALTGGKPLAKSTKLAKASATSGKIRDYLFRSTLKATTAAGKLTGGTMAGSGIIYGGLKFLGDMYDWSETSTGEFTSGLEFKPLCLLSADDLAGQENVVNHGMWLMWAGDSLNPSDDDAAYLQAMDFAAKFSEDLIETQETQGNFCNIDIYVVRPIIRNPDTEDEQLYYLIMNDTPWRGRND